ALSPQAGKPPAIVVPAAPAALPVGEPPPEPGASTHLAAMSEAEARALPPRRSLALPILLAFAVLITIGGALYLTRRADLPPARAPPPPPPRGRRPPRDGRRGAPGGWRGSRRGPRSPPPPPAPPPRPARRATPVTRSRAMPRSRPRPPTRPALARSPPSTRA